MDALKRFTIPVKGLKQGIHTFEFDLDRLFFSQFEGSPVEEGIFKVLLNLDKRPEMLVLDFNIEGKIATNCDRCLANIQLPIDTKDQTVVKYAEQPKDDDEVIYITWDTPELNVAAFIFENIVLNLPMITVYNCDEDEKPPCDYKMLDYLDNKESIPSSEDSGGEPESGNSIWSELKKNFNKDN